MVARRVKDAKNDDRIAFNAEEDFVRKSLRQHTAKVFVVYGELFGRLFQPSEGVGDGGEKFITQAGSLPLVPVPRLIEIDTRGATDGNAPLHGMLEERTLRNTSRHGVPGSPS